MKGFLGPKNNVCAFFGLPEAENDLLALNTKNIVSKVRILCVLRGGGQFWPLEARKHKKKTYFGTQKIFVLPFSGFQRPKMTSWHEIYSCCSNLAFNSWWGDCPFYLL